jgi:acyl dehydratase
MALNPEFVGRVFPPSTTYQVGREKIREFASAIGDHNLAYHDVEAARSLGYADVIAPPTFPVVIALKAATRVIKDPDFGLDYRRVVHGEQKFHYTRPIVAGDEIEVTVTITAARTMAGNDMVTTVGDVTTVQGEHLVTVTSLLIARAPEESP